MCEPTTITAALTYLGATAETAATVSTVASVASAGIAAYGTYQQARTNKAVAEANAATADRQAKDALRRGEDAATQARQRGSIVEGAQRASMAARGLDLQEGTPSDILGQTDYFSQVDQATARTNARQEASGYQARSANFRAEADATNPGLQLAGSLLGSTAKVADKWYSYRKQ